MSVLQAGLLNQSSAQVIDGSLKFDETKGFYLTRTPTSNGNRKTWTWSCWCKIAKLPVSGTNGDRTLFSAVDTSNGGDDDAIRFIRSGITGGQSLYWSSSEYNVSDEEAIYTNAVLRDPNAFYHVVLIKDTTQSSLANGQMRMYINGVEQSLVESNAISQNAERAINSQVPHAIGDHYGQDRPWDGLMSQVYLIDGLALVPEYFGYTDPLTNVWRPKKFRAEGTTVNDGTVWSSTTDSGLTHADGVTGIFDGSLSTRGGAPSTDNTYAILTNNVSISCINGIRIYWNGVGAGQRYIRINGTTELDDGSAQLTPGWSPLSSFSGTINKIEVKTASSGSWSLSAIEVDGIIMVDSTTTNLDFGTNGFYLPMDGNSPIGQDKSGKGNNWTPVNFGGSLELDNPNVSGARPILNTTQGGTQAAPGVFGSKEGFYETVSSSSGGGNPYIFDNRGTQPTLSFIRGATYVFDYSSATSHPLRFATAADAAGSTEYTDGTSVSGNVISFTVPHNAPDTLYYYCTNHSGMGNSISVTTDETKADPYAWKNVLALPLVGNASDESNRINSGSTTKTITNGGATASSANSNFYGGSYYFNNNISQYLSASSSDFDFGSNPFTIEFWFKHDETSNWNSIYFSQGAVASGVSLYQSGSNIFLRWGGNPSYAYFAFTPSNEKWYHFALVREGTGTGETKVYVDGISQTTWVVGPPTIPSISSNDISIGRFTDNTDYENYGYMQDFRIYKGVAKYTSNFIPASTNPDILPDTPSGVSGSSKLTKITDGAVSFDGDGDYLSIANNADFRMGSDPFTIEGYLYIRSTSGEDGIVSLYGYTDNRRSYEISLNSGSFRFRTDDNGSGATTVFDYSGTPLQQWFHFAVVKSSTTGTLYINGVQVASGTADATLYNNTVDDLVIGNIGPYGGSYYFNGFISNLRIIKGTALYTSNFTPPSAPLTNVTNTKLLCCQSNTQAGAAVTSPNMGGVNNGTNWSHFLTTNAGDNFDASGPKYYAFDGNGSNKAYTGNNSDGTTQGTSFLQVNFPSPISGALRVKCDNGNTVRNVTSGDALLATQSSGSDNQFVDCGNVSNLSKLRVLMSGGSRPAISVVELDGTTLVDPASPVGNAAATNFNPFNTDINTVRGQETGYATWNPLEPTVGTLSNGNLKMVGSSAWKSTKGTISVSSGKWYYEGIVNGTVYGQSVSNIAFGIGWLTTKNASSNVDANTSSLYNNLVAFHNNGGYNNFAAWQTSVATLTAGDVIGASLDKDNNTFEFFVNGNSVISGTLANTSDDLTPWINAYYSDSFFDCNFGQKPFKFPPPEGFQPLAAANVRPETVIARPDQYVGITTWTGDGTNNRVIQAPIDADFAWIKFRNQAYSHSLYDTVRGNNLRLVSNSTGTEGTVSFSFLNNKLIQISGASDTSFNDNNEPLVGWFWRAGGNKNIFNVDDVGYASASDVSMGVGGLNNIALNQSQAWSSNASGGSGVANAFNGNGPKKDNYSHSGSALTLTFSPALTGRIVVYGGTGAGSHNPTTTDTFTLSDGSVLSSQEKYNVAPYWTEMDFGEKSNISSLTCSAGYTLYAITLDGKLLVDSGVSINVPTIANTGCSVGTKQGFSIIKYTGTDNASDTFAHGLLQKPDFAIFKNISQSGDDWIVYHSSQGATKRGKINSLNAFDAQISQFNDTEPLSSFFTIGTYDNINKLNNNYISYIWHNVPGLQKFGIYDGNSSTDGPYVELGFRPALVILKAYVAPSTSVTGWVIQDSERGSYNVINSKQLYANANYAEGKRGDGSATNPQRLDIDFLSNGFKLRDIGNEINATSYSYIYAAWAEAPAFNLYGGQSNAR